MLGASTRLDTRPRRLAIAMAIAFVLHAPLMPTRLLGFIDLLGARTDVESGEPLEGEAFVPIDLDLDDLKLPGDGTGDGVDGPGANGAPGGPGATAEGDIVDAPPPSMSASVAPPPPPPPAPPPPPPPPPPPTTSPDDQAMDAGVPDAEPPDAGENVADASPEDAGVPDSGANDAGDAGPPARDAGPGPIASVTPPDAGAPKGPGIGDPQQVAGVGQGLTPQPNVQVLLVGKQLRAHPLGADFGKLLRDIKQWRGFFDGTGIDPVADVDHMLITGPELRNSAKVVAVMELNVPPEKVKSAIDVVVKRDKKGEWLTGTAFPTARAKADGAERLFVHLPARNALTVLPGDDVRLIPSLRSAATFRPNLPFAIQLSMVTPHRAFRGIDAITMPESIAKMRLRVVTDAQGGATLELEFFDADASKAKEHELVLEDQWKKVQTAALLGLIFLDDLDFTANGDLISGKTHFTKEQLAKIMSLARGNLMDEPKKSGKKQGKKK